MGILLILYNNNVESFESHKTQYEADYDDDDDDHDDDYDDNDDNHDDDYDDNDGYL